MREIFFKQTWLGIFWKQLLNGQIFWGLRGIWCTNINILSFAIRCFAGLWIFRIILNNFRACGTLPLRAFRTLFRVQRDSLTRNSLVRNFFLVYCKIDFPRNFLAKSRYFHANISFQGTFHWLHLFGLSPSHGCRALYKLLIPSHFSSHGKYLKAQNTAGKLRCSAPIVLSYFAAVIFPKNYLLFAFPGTVLQTIAYCTHQQ